MFDHSISKNILSSLNTKEKLAVFGAVLGITVAVSGFFLIWTNANQTKTPEHIEELVVGNAEEIVKKITTDIGGAVVKPGVYELDPGSRVSHLIQIAEGFLKTADSYYIAHDLNLAESLADGQKVYIPFEGELNAQTKKSKEGELGVGSLISINNATKTELDSLEGVGEVRAEAIISNRPYQLLTDLVTKKVLSQSQFEAIEKQLKL